VVFLFCIENHVLSWWILFIRKPFSDGSLFSFDELLNGYSDILGWNNEWFVIYNLPRVPFVG